MKIDKIIAKDFRNLDGEIILPSRISLIVGENNAGKSNLIDALRLLTYPHAGVQFSRWVRPEDFRHDAAGNRVVDTFSLEAVLSDLSSTEMSRMVTCLAPSEGKSHARLQMKAHVNPAGRILIEWFGGDSRQAGVEQYAKEALSHTYLPPLRDATAELRPGRANLLVQLIGALAPANTTERQEIEKAAEQANATLSDVKAVKKARTDVQQQLEQMVGPAFAQKTDLAFADARFDRVIGSIRALAGDDVPLELAENGLGLNNLLYMASLLAAIEGEAQDGLHVLLIEEPEAHLHPQLQDLLMRFLETRAGGHTQVVVTTHSPNFSSAAGVEKITVLVRGEDRQIQARVPAAFGMSKRTTDHLARFLDVTKAGILYARGVILVEGIAEQLLMPTLAKQIGVSLVESGITVVNVGGLSFGPFADLFDGEKLPVRCALVSDGDPIQNEESEEEGAEDNGASEVDQDLSISATATSLKTRQNDVMKVFLSERTFEWDLAHAGNWETLIAALSMIKPRVAASLKRDHASSDVSEQADAILGAVKEIKGRFAQAVARVVEEQKLPFTPPSYLADAIRWAARANPETKAE